MWIGLSRFLIRVSIVDSEYLAFLSESVTSRYLMGFLLLAGVITSSLFWYRLGEQEFAQRRSEENQNILKEAELFKLRQQLQPHFLFNSLNSINSLIGSRPEQARNMIQQLSEFLRGTIKREEHSLVSLQEELEYLKLYLDIEQVRFGHRLEVDIDCDENCMDQKLPALLLQPLMENAIKFGLYGTTENIRISLKCTTTDSMLEIEMSNPFDEDSPQAPGTGFGLHSVKRRLYLLYARKDLLTIHQEERLFIVNLQIPLLYDQSTDN